MMNISSHVSEVSLRTQREQSQARPVSPAIDTCEVNVVHLEGVRSARATLPTSQTLARVTDLLGLLANPTRLKVLLALRPSRDACERELCVCDLAVVAGASKSMTSHQLRLLRTAGLVLPRRDGKLTFYRLADGPILALLDEALGLALGEGRL